MAKKRAIAKPAKASGKPKNFDDYLARVTSDQRVALEKLRQVIRAIVPQAEECISYQLPAFRLDGKVLIALGATSKHCALYLMSGQIVERFQDLLVPYDTSKGTIRFAADKPLPAALVRKLVKARMAECEG